GAALPVGLTLIATAFAGLSTSEMTHAMYWRSAAAQDQGKVNDQWSLAGFKRDRALIMQTSAARLRMAANYHAPLSLPEKVLGATAREWLAGNGPPRVDLPPVEDPNIRALLDAIRERKPENELVRLGRSIDRVSLDRTIYGAEVEVGRVDAEW